MTSASPSPKSPEVSEKSKKYDRQLRLWGDHGQHKLEKSHICLINANATGTEILKSLVLPGCGMLTIVDEHRVTQKDIGVNFFLDADSLNKPRAECALNFLLELNSDVSGEHISASPSSILSSDPSFFTRFSIVIGCQLDERVLIDLSKLLWNLKIPFVSVQTTGFLGWTRIQLNEHTIIESHPLHPPNDLRLDAPFSELITHMDSVLIKNREDAVKTPWFVLLYKGLQSYIRENAQNGQNGTTDNGNIPHPPNYNDAAYPKTGKQKNEFKTYLKQYLESTGLKFDDDSFEESVKAVNTALSKTIVPEEVNAILANPKTARPENKFWVLCTALKEFVDEYRHLPVRGVLPDMTADSEKYIGLQNVYREKASKDANDIFDRANRHIRQSGSGIHGLNLSIEDVRLFCKESYGLRLTQGYPIYEELNTSPHSVLKELAQNTEDCDMEQMFYVMLRGYLRFHKEFCRYPGVDDVESDVTNFKTIISGLLAEWNSTVECKHKQQDCIHEICRYGAAEIPSVAAFIGGSAAQEAIKIITGQYVPVDNTFIYNAVHSTSKSFKMKAETESCTE